MTNHDHDPTFFGDILQQRREFLKLMGASLGVAGLSACVKQPEERIYPHVRAPEYLIPGRPRFYATTLSRGGIGRGALVESHEGRPTKVEGNDKHPASLGGTDVWMQAEILGLYDPDRSQSTLRNGAPSTWNRFVRELLPTFGRNLRGQGTAIVTGSITSPTLAAQLRALQTKLPDLRWVQWESVNADERFHATKQSFGQPLDLTYDFSKADVVVAFDADPLFAEPGSVRYARDAAKRRRDTSSFSRWYVVENSPTCTGLIADHRIRARRADIASWVLGLAQKLGLRPGAPALDNDHLKAMASDLRANKGRALVVVGPHQPAAVQSLVFEINEHLGARGQTFQTIKPVAAAPVSHTDDLRKLTAEMNAGEVESLLVLGANPVFDAPADFEFEAAFQKVPKRVHVGLYADETAHLSHWHLPGRHVLESWSDAKAYDGTTSLVQPLLKPLYGGHAAHELIALIGGEPSKRDHDLVRAHYAKQWGDQTQRRWRTVLHDGLIAGTAHAAVTTQPKPVELKPAAAPNLELTFAPDATIWDGQHANNAWLQELPKPITKLVWDNAALISPATAKRLGVASNDLVSLTVGKRNVEAAAMIVPGQADDSVSLSLGGGRRRGGRVAPKTGFDAQRVRASDAAWSAPLAIGKTGRTFALVTTQKHHRMEGRELVRYATLDEHQNEPDFAKAPEKKVAKLSLYPEVEREGPQWGMSINLGGCIGCNACVVACQSENNIPVVGKPEVEKGREMHWLRIDSYDEGDTDDVTIHQQPVTCMHCENAPCEVVCPVNATVTGPSGINEMVYNRCVGTRYCSNNCPYKVRRFNFFLYQDWETPSFEPMRNPDVSVRSRGVMEKCTFCIQRIQQARIVASKEDREVRDGEIVTACQGACPTEAITFGNVADPKSAVSQEKSRPLDYTILEELNTKARVSYTAKLTNPHADLDKEKTKG